MKRFLASIWEILEIVLIAVVTVFLIRSFLVQPFLVSGASMEPNFSDGNYLLVDEITYRLREPERGEVVVFRYPLDKSLFFIKRIIGMPNERVIAEGGRIKILKDGKEMYIKESYLSSNFNDNFEVTLGDNQYFVLGDNRSHSFDSRNWGAITKDDIVGITRMRILPIDEFVIFDTPMY